MLQLHFGLHDGANSCCASFLTAADGQASQRGCSTAGTDFAWHNYSSVNESGDRQILLSLTALLKYLAQASSADTAMVAPGVMAGSVCLADSKIQPKGALLSSTNSKLCQQASLKLGTNFLSNTKILCDAVGVHLLVHTAKHSPHSVKQPECGCQSRRVFSQTPSHWMEINGKRWTRKANCRYCLVSGSSDEQIPMQK